ncbi:MAG TPA: MauE/DoxX family redox-associated membrane protein [Candidatus Limnocylindrales bacterium]|nr:MauE/DoxX family redox-associated membrane protein [Candidatus Limnocylindrales bacterium]
MMQSAPFNYRRIVIWIGRLVLAFIFIYAGLAKMIRWDMHPRPPLGIARSLFALQIDSYQMLPPWASIQVARWLPWAEIALGLLLLLGWRLKIWSTLVTLIVGGFFFAVLRAYLLHLDINCGCFAKPEPLNGLTVLRDGALFLLAIIMTVFAFQEARRPHAWAVPAPERPS